MFSSRFEQGRLRYLICSHWSVTGYHWINQAQSRVDQIQARQIHLAATFLFFPLEIILLWYSAWDCQRYRVSSSVVTSATTLCHTVSTQPPRPAWHSNSKDHVGLEGQLLRWNSSSETSATSVRDRSSFLWCIFSSRVFISYVVFCRHHNFLFYDPFCQCLLHTVLHLYISSLLSLI